MADPRSFDLVIVGAGIAGAALAASLRGHGLSIALVEGRPLDACPLSSPAPEASYDPRVSALTARSRTQLQQLGAWQDIVDYRCCPYRHMTVWDADGTGLIEFDSSEVSADALGYIAENLAINAALLRQVRGSQDITLINPASLESCMRLSTGELRMQLADGDVIDTGLLVAADGAQSRVRSLLQFATREWDYGQTAIVTTARLERPHEETAWQRFLPSGPLAFLPLPGGPPGGGPPGGSYCSIVWSLQDERVQDLLDLEDSAFCSALGEAFEWRLGSVLDCSPRFAFPLRQRHAVDYVQPGVALIGDAAHTIHPLAGQGINLGLQDVAVLAEELINAIARGADPGSLAVLRRYQRRRKGENLLMMTAMEGFKRLFEQNALPVRWLRNSGMRHLDAVGLVKRGVMRRAMGLERR